MIRLQTNAVLLMSLFMPATSSATAGDDLKGLVAFLNEIDAIVQDDGVPAAVKKVESLSDTTEVMRKYFIVTNHIYRKKHDVDLVPDLGRAGMVDLLDQAAKVSATDVEQAERL